jgi:hypothetical protein
MGSGWKTYLGIAIIALSIVGKIVGAEIPNIDNSSDLGSLLGTAMALLGIRDKLNKI